MTAPAVLGLDLSMTATGVALPDGTLATIRPKTEGDVRLATIADTIGHHIRDRRPDLVVIEDLPTHAHSAGITGMVHGAVRGMLVHAGAPYTLIAPATLKKFATGRGNATKADMRMALFQRTGLDVRDDNQVDACWLRHAGLHLLDAAELPLPKAQRDALAKAKLGPREAAA